MVFLKKNPSRPLPPMSHRGYVLPSAIAEQLVWPIVGLTPFRILRIIDEFLPNYQIGVTREV